MQPGKTFSSIFYVRSRSGNVLSADSVPACILIRNGIDTVVAVSIVQLADNAYLAQSLIPSNWADGDVVHLRINATSNGLNLTETKVLGVVSATAGSFNSSDRNVLVAMPLSVSDILTMIRELYKRQGLYNGVSAAVRDAEEGVPGLLTTSDGSIGQSLVKAGVLTTISRTNPAPPLNL